MRAFTTFIAAMIIAISLLLIGLQDADAKRLGGGRSFRW